MQFPFLNIGTGARSRRLAVSIGCLLAGLFITTGCALNMYHQPKYEPLEESEFFQDQRSARPLADHTVARGYLETDQALYAGTNGDGSPVETFPFEITGAVLERGRERYDIYCAPCHSRLGNGQGMIVQRGFKSPASFHIERLREAPVGYYYDVITNGFGAMYSYASRINPEDRWAIIAYIRVLQLSQNGSLEDVPAAERDKLQRTEE